MQLQAYEMPIINFPFTLYLPSRNFFLSLILFNNTTFQSTHSMYINASKDNGWSTSDSVPIVRVHSHGEGGIDVGVGVDGTRHDLEALHHCTHRSIGDGQRDKKLMEKSTNCIKCAMDHIVDDVTSCFCNVLCIWDWG